VQLAEDRAIAFTAGRPPLLLERGDWRTSSLLAARQGRPAPVLPAVPPLPDLEPPADTEPEPTLLHAIDAD
jgi:hypothetical protein